MKAIIRPSKARGTVTAPPSKSMAHRLLICAGLSEGESVIRHLAFSDDTEATILSLRALGAEITLDGDTAYVKGTDITRFVPGGAPVLPCHECGSTLRFFIPLCMLSGRKYILTGSEYLMSRPLTVYEDIAAAQDIRFTKAETSVTVEGRLCGGVYEFPGNISSQFVSGLLFALPLLDTTSEIRLIPPVESRPYIDLTLSALRTFGIAVTVDGDTYRIKGGQHYTPSDVTVEGDYSNAAFFEALNYAGSRVMTEGLNEFSLQGDRIYKILFKNIKNKTSEPVDISDCPDLGPVLFAVAAMCGGATFIGTRRLRMKESDRAAAMREELEKFGIRLHVGENRVTVSQGVLKAPTGPLFGHGDHRIVMALAVLSTVTGAEIEGAEAVKKSFPDFFEKLRSLGVDIAYGMDQ